SNANARLKTANLDQNQEKLASEIEEIKTLLNQLLNKPASQNPIADSEENQSSTIINNRIETKGSEASQNQPSSISETDPDSIPKTQDT
ncbi:MAG: hypothetical protein ABR595_05400, partial [Psychroflexus sp.]